jgi:hypothetical protein
VCKCLHFNQIKKYPVLRSAAICPNWYTLLYDIVTPVLKFDRSEMAKMKIRENKDAENHCINNFLSTFAPRIANGDFNA